jgi:hypothetical protein
MTRRTLLQTPSAAFAAQAGARSNPAVEENRNWARSIGSSSVDRNALKAGMSWPADLPAYASNSPGGADLVRIPVRFLRIGDSVLWATPFCEIAIRVRNESPFRNTIFLGYANGWLGYLPTAEAFRE